MYNIEDIVYLDGYLFTVFRIFPEFLEQSIAPSVVRRCFEHPIPLWREGEQRAKICRGMSPQQEL